MHHILKNRVSSYYVLLHHDRFGNLCIRRISSFQIKIFTLTASPLSVSFCTDAPDNAFFAFVRTPFLSKPAAIIFFPLGTLYAVTPTSQPPSLFEALLFVYGALNVEGSVYSSSDFAVG